MTYAIVILSHKTSGLTLRLIRHIIENDSVLGEQIFVIDNSLDDNEADILLKSVKTIRFNLEILPKNEGYGAGNNSGIELAFRRGYRNFFILNPDVLPEPGIFSNMHKKYFDTPPGYCIGPNVKNPFTGLSENPLRRPEYLLNLFGISRMYKQEYQPLVGCFLYLDSTYWLGINKFPEEVFLYNEEIIIFFKAMNEGFRNIHDNSFLVQHLHEKTFNGLGTEINRKRKQLVSANYILRYYMGKSYCYILFYSILFKIRTIFILCYKLFRYGWKRN